MKRALLHIILNTRVHCLLQMSFGFLFLAFVMLCGEIVLGGETINDTGTEILSNSTIIQCQL